MAQVTFRFIISKERLDKIVNNDRVKQFAAETFYRYMYEYIPIYTGKLADNVEISPRGILFKQPYAVRNYFEHRNWHRTHHPEHPKNAPFEPKLHPKATEHWGEVAMVNHKDDIVREIENYIEGQP